MKRSAVAAAHRTLILAVGAARGQPFKVSPWEAYFTALPEYRPGRWVDAIAKILEGLRERPGNPALLCHLACAKARADRANSAIERLRQAINAEAAYFDAARTECESDAIRASPGFPVVS
jgi:predicted Zn-dependent protease